MEEGKKERREGGRKGGRKAKLSQDCKEIRLLPLCVNNELICTVYPSIKHQKVSLTETKMWASATVFCSLS